MSTEYQIQVLAVPEGLDAGKTSLKLALCLSPQFLGGVPPCGEDILLAITNLVNSIEKNQFFVSLVSTAFSNTTPDIAPKFSDSWLRIWAGSDRPSQPGATPVTVGEQTARKRREIWNYLVPPGLSAIPFVPESDLKAANNQRDIEVNSRAGLHSVASVGLHELETDLYRTYKKIATQLITFADGQGIPGQGSPSTAEEASVEALKTFVQGMAANVEDVQRFSSTGSIAAVQASAGESSDGGNHGLPRDAENTDHFHEVFSRMLEFPKLLRYLGLIIDLEIPASKIPRPPSTFSCQPAVKCEVTTAFPAQPQFLFLPSSTHLAVNNGLPAQFILEGAKPFLPFTGPGRDDVNFTLSQIDILGPTTQALQYHQSGILDTSQTKGPPPLRSSGISILRGNVDWIQEQVVGRQPGELLTSADQHRAHAVHVLDRDGRNEWQSLASRQSAVFIYRQGNQDSAGNRSQQSFLLVWLKDGESEQVRVIDDLKNPWGALPPLADILRDRQETREVAAEETGVHLSLNVNPQPVSGVVIHITEICPLSEEHLLLFSDFVVALRTSDQPFCKKLKGLDFETPLDLARALNDLMNDKEMFAANAGETAADDPAIQYRPSKTVAQNRRKLEEEFPRFVSTKRERYCIIATPQGDMLIKTTSAMDFPANRLREYQFTGQLQSAKGKFEREDHWLNVTDWSIIGDAVAGTVVDRTGAFDPANDSLVLKVGGVIQSLKFNLADETTLPQWIYSPPQWDDLGGIVARGIHQLDVTETSWNAREYLPRVSVRADVATSGEGQLALDDGGLCVTADSDSVVSAGGARISLSDAHLNSSLYRDPAGVFHVLYDSLSVRVGEIGGQRLIPDAIGSKSLNLPPPGSSNDLELELCIDDFKLRLHESDECHIDQELLVDEYVMVQACVMGANDQNNLAAVKITRRNYSSKMGLFYVHGVHKNETLFVLRAAGSTKPYDVAFSIPRSPRSYPLPQVGSWVLVELDADGSPIKMPGTFLRVPWEQQFWGLWDAEKSRIRTSFGAWQMDTSLPINDQRHLKKLPTGTPIQARLSQKDGGLILQAFFGVGTVFEKGSQTFELRGMVDDRIISSKPQRLF